MTMKVGELSPFSTEEKAAIEKCMTRILDDPIFAKSRPISRFFRYIVTETLDGRSDRLKGYNIALSVFDRKESFNPQTNSIVRVEATRMRKALAGYYSNRGRSDSYEIRLERGSYIPLFILRKDPLEAPIANDTNRGNAAGIDSQRPALGSSFGRPQENPDNPPVLPKSPHFGVLACILLILGSLTAYAIWLAAEEHTNETASRHLLASSPPSIAVSAITGTSDDQAKRSPFDILNHDIVSKLANFELLTVIEDNGRRPTSDTEYRLIGRAEINQQSTSLSFRLMRTDSNQTIWSKAFAGLSPDLPKDERMVVLSSLVGALAQSYGVIFADRFQNIRVADSQVLGFDCILLSYKYLNAPSISAYLTSRECLQRSLKNDPKISSSHAILAMLTLDGFLNGFEDADFEQSVIRILSLGRVAVELDPKSALARQALFIGQFYSGRFEEAFATATEALSLNPFSIDLASRIGSAYIVRGQYDKGMSFLSRVPGLDESKLSWIEFYFFLASFMQKDQLTAYRHAMHVSTTRTPLGIAARIIAASRSGDSIDVERSIARLRSDFPQFAGNIGKMLSQMQMTDDIIRALLDELAIVGVRPGPH